MARNEKFNLDLNNDENFQLGVDQEEEDFVVDFGEVINTGGGTNYNELSNKPKINGITLQGNKNGTDYNLADIYSLVFTVGEQGAIYANQEDLDYIYQYVPTYLKVSGNFSGAEINQIFVLLGENNITGSYSGELIYFTYQDWSNNYVMVRIPKNASSPLNFIEYDFYTKSESDNKYQAKLVSGTNIKTINNVSILGSGNIDTNNVKSVTPTSINISEDPFGVTITLSSVDCADIVAKKYDFVTLLVENQLGINITCAKQADNNSLCGYFCQIDTGSDVYYYSWACTSDGIYDNVTKKIDTPTNVSAFTNDAGYITSSYHDSSKQDTLVSGTNIKTINNQSILGSGNLSIDVGGGANLTPLEVPNNSLNLYDFIMDAEYPETYTISNDSDVVISIEKESGTDEVWVQKGSIISVYPQYSATILSADGMYMYYIDWESGEYLTGGGAVDYETVVQIVDDIVDTSNFVDLTSDQTITGKKTFKDSGIEFQKTGYNPKSGLEAGTNGLAITYTDGQGNKSTKLGIGSQYNTTDQDLIPRNDYSYNAMTGEYTGTNLGKSDKKYNIAYIRALSADGQNNKEVSNLLTNNANLIPYSSAAYTLGNANNKWNGLYLYGNIEMSVGDINQVRAITANEYRVKDGNFNNNYFSLLKYAYVSPGKTVAQLQNGIDVNNRVIHNIGTPDDDTSPISKGYADNHYQGTLTFDSTPTDDSSNPVTSNGIFDAIQNVIEIAEGKTATYTLSYDTTGNADFNSQNASITVSSFVDTAGNTITDADVKVGDIVLVVEVDVPDRWVQSIDTTNHTITLYKMETSKIDLSNYVDRTTDQTISATKRFLADTVISHSRKLKFYDVSNYGFSLGNSGSGGQLYFYNPSNTATYYMQTNSFGTLTDKDLGSSTYKWNNLYLAGSLNDGTNQTNVANINNNFAPIYDNTTTYAVGDRVIYNGRLYRCTTAITTAEDWDATHWTEASVSGNYIDKDTNQTITGTKTFSGDIRAGVIRSTGGTVVFNLSSSNAVTYGNVRPSINNSGSIGTSERIYSNVYTYNINDGTNQTSVSKINNNFAPKYDATATYNLGDRCVYQGAMYECTTAITIAEDWDSTHWTAKSVDDLIGNINTALAGLVSGGGVQ